MKYLGILIIQAVTSLGKALGLFDRAVSNAVESFREQANRNPDTVLVAQQRLQRFVTRVLVAKLIIGFVVLLGSLTHTNPFTPAGSEGYVYERPRIIGAGGFQGTVAGPGNFGLSFFRNEAINIDIRPQTYTEEFKVLTRDDLEISFNFHAVLSIEPKNVQSIVEAYGGLDWYARFVREPFRSYVRDAIQKHRSTDVKSFMASVSDDVERQLKTYISGSPFKLVGLVAGKVDYPPEVAQAVERKLTSQQLLEEKEIQRQIAAKDAEIEIVRANSRSEAQKIIAATLTPMYLQHQAIEAQLQVSKSSKAATIYIPVANNGIPIVHPTPAPNAVLDDIKTPSPPAQMDQKNTLAVEQSKKTAPSEPISPLVHLFNTTRN